MKRKFIVCLLALFFTSTAFAEPVKTALKMPDQPRTIIGDKTLADIKTTLGIVPTFFQNYPAEALPGAWEEMKNVQLSANTAIPGKYKELIGLAVASQVPCTYCAHFHTEAAKLNGCNDRELHEAIALSGLEHHWSTFLNGIQADDAVFRQEVDTFVKKAKEEQAKASGTTPQPMNEMMLTTPEDVYKDAEALLGTTPTFLKSFPKAGVVGAWKTLKTLTLRQDTAIPAKYKDLITLAVSSQIPCHYCIYFDTQAAKLDGASEDEISEAITLSSISRQWSTVLNGNQTDMVSFRKEVSQIMAHLKTQSNIKQIAAK